MYSVEFHTPITMNEHFSVMCYLQVKSLSRNARLPGDWRVVYTVSLDSDLDEDAPQFAWARDFPVEFQRVERGLWEEMGYVGTGLQCITAAHRADAVVFMDADMVVCGSLAELIAEIAGDRALFGWPAWYSGDAPFSEIFRAAGLDADVDYRITLTDAGADHERPDWPPYFNFGFIGASRPIAEDMARSFPGDQRFVMERFENYFAGQVALALNIQRNGYPCRIIDERFNVGSDHPLALAHSEEKLGRRMLPSQAAVDDPRILHYCFPTPTFRKKRDFADWIELRRFMDSEGLEGFEARLQACLADLDLFGENDAYHRNFAPLAGGRLQTKLEEARADRDRERARLEKRSLGDSPRWLRLRERTMRLEALRAIFQKVR